MKGAKIGSQNLAVVCCGKYRRRFRACKTIRALGQVCRVPQTCIGFSSAQANLVRYASRFVSWTEAHEAQRIESHPSQRRRRMGHPRSCELQKKAGKMGHPPPLTKHAVLGALEISGADSSGLAEALPKIRRRNTGSSLGTACRCVDVVFAPPSLSGRSDADMQDRVLLVIPS